MPEVCTVGQSHKEIIEDSIKEKTGFVLSNSLVFEHNDLIHGHSNSSLLQLKIFLISISKIKKDDIELKGITLDVKSLAKDLGLPVNHYYAQIREAVKGLFRRSIVIPPKNPDEKELEFALVSKAAYDAKTMTIYVKLNDELKPYLLNLKNNFASFNLALVYHFKSKRALVLFLVLYAELMRWHSYTKQYTEGIEVSYTIDEIKKALELGEKYKYDNIRRKVLMQVKNEIETLLPFSLDIEMIKEHRAASGFRLTFRAKPEALDSDGLPLISKTRLAVEGYYDKDSEKYKKLIDGLNRLKIKNPEKLIEIAENDLDRVRSNLTYILLKYGQIFESQIAAMVTDAIKKDYAGQTCRERWLNAKFPRGKKLEDFLVEG